MRARDGTFSLPETELNDWGYQLMNRGLPQQAVHIFKLATFLYPDSANAHDSLADGQEQAGNRGEAIANYRRALQLDPGNKNAAARLALLEAQRAGR